jgi:hypothetical protein
MFTLEIAGDSVPVAEHTPAPSLVFESISAFHVIVRPVLFGNVTQHWPLTSGGLNVDEPVCVHAS